MKLQYNLELQYNGNATDVATLETCIDNYLKANKYTKKNTNVYLNLDENMAYVVETAKGEVKNNAAVSFATLLADYAVEEKPAKAEKPVKAPKTVKETKEVKEVKTEPAKEVKKVAEKPAKEAKSTKAPAAKTSAKTK